MTPMWRSRLPVLRRDERGATIIEFAFVAPVFCLLLIGAIDVGHTLYMKAILQGVVQKAARDSSLEDGTMSSRQTTIDTRVRNSVLDLHKDAAIAISRRYYRTFEKASAAQAETYTDTNMNGTCDAGEPFVDANNNAKWDIDGASDGQGGAQDVVVYTADIAYPRMVPLHNFIPAFSEAVNVKAVAVLANQPYGEQSQYGAPTVGNCP